MRFSSSVESRPTSNSPSSRGLSSFSPVNPSVTSTTRTNYTTHLNENLVQKQEKAIQELDVIVNKYLKLIELPYHAKLIGVLSLDATAYSAGSSRSLPFDMLNHASEAEAQLSRVIKDLDRDISQSGLNRNDLAFSKYLNKLQRLSASKFSATEITPLNLLCEDWKLITLAAEFSYVVYSTTAKLARFDEVKQKIQRQNGDIKSFVVFDVTNGDQKIIVVAIKGSEGWYDWMVNLNCDPCDDTSQYIGSAAWHNGLLHVARGMEDIVARKLQDEVNELQRDGTQLQNISIIFTGHSAGGGVAELLYIMSQTAGTQLFNTLEEINITQVKCYTFASPPVCAQNTLPITFLRNDPIYHIINEGDPVALAQIDYLPTIKRVWLSRIEEINDSAFSVPDLTFHPTERCWLIRDTTNDGSDSLEIGKVSPARLEKKFFGDIPKHSMEEYRRRVRKLAKDNCTRLNHTCQGSIRFP